MHNVWSEYYMFMKKFISIYHMTYQQAEEAIREIANYLSEGKYLVSGNLIIQMFQLTNITCHNEKRCAKIPNFSKQWH